MEMTLAKSQETNNFDALVTQFGLPRVNSMGTSIFDPIWREKEHAGRHTELLHIIAGSFDMVMPDCTIHGQAGDTVLTPANTPHRDVFPPDTRFEVYLIHFDWQGEKELLRRFTPAQLAHVSPAGKAQLASEFRAMYQIFQQHTAWSNELTSLKLLQILIMLCSEADAAQQSPQPDTAGQARRRQIMDQARALIQKHYHEPLSLDDIAEALHISPYHLSHVFSAESGFTLSSYLTSIRMQRAAELLRTAKLSVSEIAVAVGYRDPQYFSRVFRSNFGTSPSAYRTQASSI